MVLLIASLLISITTPLGSIAGFHLRFHLRIPLGNSRSDLSFDRCSRPAYPLCAELEQAEQDPNIILLSRQFKATAMELISILQLKQKNSGQIKVLLYTVPASIFVASFELEFEEQISMLDSVDLKLRLSKATKLVEHHLQYSMLDGSITELFILF